MADWPPTVLAENNAARFTFAGGRERVPLLVDGLTDWRDFALERLAEGQWVPVRHHLLTPHDGGQVRALDGGKFRAVFLPTSTGEIETYRVRQVAPSRGPMLAVAPFAPQGDAFRQVRLALPGGTAPIVLDFPARLAVNSRWHADPKVSGVANGGWQESEGGSWWFEETRGAIKVGGRVTPMEGEAELEFWIANSGPDPVLAEGALGWRPAFAVDQRNAFVQRGDAWVALADGPAHQDADDLVLVRHGNAWVGVLWDTDLNTATILDDAGQAPKARREREFDAGRRYYARGKVVFAEGTSREEAAKRLRLGL
jgi:hypothetical protein